MSHFFSFKEHNYPFSKVVFSGSNITGSLVGNIVVKNAPLMGQILGGLHNEKGIVKGQPLIIGVPLPKLDLREFIYSMFLLKAALTCRTIRTTSFQHYTFATRLGIKSRKLW